MTFLGAIGFLRVFYGKARLMESQKVEREN